MPQAARVAMASKPKAKAKAPPIRAQCAELLPQVLQALEGVESDSGEPAQLVRLPSRRCRAPHCPPPAACC